MLNTEMEVIESKPTTLSTQLSDIDAIFNDPQTLQIEIKLTIGATSYNIENLRTKLNLPGNSTLPLPNHIFDGHNSQQAH
jgi:hypothetical protein